MKKRFTLVLLSLVLVIGLMPVTAFAAGEQISMEKYTCELDPATKTATVVRSLGSDEVIIPETIEYEGETYTVTKIGDDAFRNNRLATKVQLPDTITEIGNSAFIYCDAIESINLPSSLTTIGEKAFWGCSAWKENINIPEGVTEIPGAAFQGCFSVTGLTIPSTVTTIGKNAFENFGVYNEASMSLTIPTNVTYIDKDAFLRAGFSKVTVSDGRTEILTLNGAFRYCSNLESVEILSGDVAIGNSEFSSCAKLSSVTLADGITSIGSFAFSHTTNDDPSYALSEVVIPASVTSIGSSVFGRCLDAVVYYPSDAAHQSNFYLSKTQVGYSVNEDGTITIDSVNGTALDKTPETLNGKKISAVPEAYKPEDKHFHYFRTDEVYCTICGTLDPDHVHTALEKIEKVEATCTADGKEAYYTCETCGKYFEDEAGKVEIENLDGYGNISATDHEAGTAWKSDGINHWKECTKCGEKLNEAPHSGGEATCTAPAVCTECGQPYGSVNPDNHTGEIVWTKTATTHSSAYSCCHVPVVTEEAHEWENGVCSECGYACQHDGGTATCSQLAVCDICGSQYGELDPDNHKAVSEWTQDNGKHYHKCAYGCDTHLDEADCSGGEVTCTEKAVCEVCGREYGEINASNHTNLVKTEARPATHMTVGNTEYWYCDGCGKYFSDAAGTKEIALADTVIEKISEHTADKTGWHSDETSHWNTCECGAVLNGAAHTFAWVTDREATATEAGLRHEECTVCGYEKAAVEIPATGTPADTDTPTDADQTEDAAAPQTGDDGNIALWTTVMLAAGTAFAGTMIYNRKKKHSR